MEFWWSGSPGGLGNRLVAMAAIIAAGDGHKFYFRWRENDACPGKYEHILDPIPSLTPVAERLPGLQVIRTSTWNPMQIYNQLNMHLGRHMPLDEFSRRFVVALRSMPFKQALIEEAQSWRQTATEGELIGIHLRRTDRFERHRKSLTEQSQELEILPLYQRFLYAYAPGKMISGVENLIICRTIRKARSNRVPIQAAIFSDSAEELKMLVQFAKATGIPGSRFVKTISAPRRPYDSNFRRRRETGLRASVVDFISLSTCERIIQNNNLSTFSIAAALYGSSSIISVEPSNSIWQVAKQSSLI